MAQNSMPPPSSGGGYGKYLVVLLLLLVAGGLGAFLVMSKPKNEPKAPQPEPPKVERSTALVDEALEIPDPVVDAGVPKPAEEPTRPKRTGGGGNSWECAGDIPQKDIKQVLAESQTQVRSCYERRLRNNNLLRGNVSLEVKVGAGGKVVATRIRGTLGDKDVYSCVQNLAKNWTFPPPSGGSCAVFNAPYNFTPKN